MTYRLTSFGKTRTALPGVKWADLTDEEYAEAVAANPGMETQGYFVKDEPAPEVKEEASSRRRAQPEDMTPAKEKSDG